MKSRALVTTFLVLVTIGASPRAQSKTGPSTVPPGMVVFDGKENPESLPEYVVWTQAFLTLEFAQREKAKLIQGSLTLSEAEAALVYKEAVAIRLSQTKSHERQEAILAATKQTDKAWKEAYQASQDVEYQFRLAVLDARDRLMTALSIEGQMTLERWVNDRRKAIKVMVPAEDVESFKRPRN
jgi:hypothetical protein